MDPGDASRRRRPTDLSSCLVDGQRHARYRGRFDRYWHCAKQRSSRGWRAN